MRMYSSHVFYIFQMFKRGFFQKKIIFLLLLALNFAVLSCTRQVPCAVYAEKYSPTEENV